MRSAINPSRLLVLSLAIAWACDGPTSPTPVRSTPTLVIRPEVEALKVGTRVDLEAVLVGADGRTERVTASWSSDAASVAAVSPTGEVAGLRTGHATIRASYESWIATRALRVVPDVDGTWTGEYRIVACERTSGGGPSSCRFVIGAVFPFGAVLRQIGEDVSGTLDLRTNDGQPFESGPIRGRVDPSGALTLEGTTYAVDPTHRSETILSDWNTTLDGATGVMTGRFVKNTAFQNLWGLQKNREECEVVRLSRSPAAAP